MRMAKTSKELLKESADARKAARDAERAEYEAFGREAAGLLAPEVAGATDRIEAAREALTELASDEVEVESVAQRVNESVAPESAEPWATR